MISRVCAYVSSNFCNNQSHIPTKIEHCPQPYQQPIASMPDQYISKAGPSNMSCPRPAATSIDDKTICHFVETLVPNLRRGYLKKIAKSTLGLSGYKKLLTDYLKLCTVKVSYKDGYAYYTVIKPTEFNAKNAGHLSRDERRANNQLIIAAKKYGIPAMLSKNFQVGIDIDAPVIAFSPEYNDIVTLLEPESVAGL